MQHLLFSLTAVFALALAAPPPQNLARGTTTLTAPSGAEGNDTADNIGLITQLENAPTALDRIKLLPDSKDHVFDFRKPAGINVTTTGLGGHTVKVDRKNFPALIGTGVAMTVGFLGPCGFNTPHTHPRSSEINIVVEGALIANFVTENGATNIRSRIEEFQVTVFPQGALHTEYNPLCTPSTFVAGFGSEDPGVLQAAQSLFDIDDDLVQAAFKTDFTFPGDQLDQFRSMIPANVALGVESCLKTCGIAKK